MPPCLALHRHTDERPRSGLSLCLYFSRWLLSGSCQMDSPGNCVPAGFWQVIWQPKPKTISTRTHLPFQHWYLEHHGPTCRTQQWDSSTVSTVLTFQLKNVQNLKQRGRLQIHQRESKEGKSTERWGRACILGKTESFHFHCQSELIKCRSNHVRPFLKLLCHQPFSTAHKGHASLWFLLPAPHSQEILNQNTMSFYSPHFDSIASHVFSLELFARKWPCYGHSSILSNKVWSQ